jgi:hypothetical protein
MFVVAISSNLIIVRSFHTSQFKLSGISRRVVWKMHTDVSTDLSAVIFRVKQVSK